MSDATVIPAPPRLLLDSLFNPSDDLTNIALFRGSDASDIATPISPHVSRPFVTLTFAQSLDAKIAGKAGKQLILSGKESMVMTHWMRAMHDAIMIGIGTALNDNPQLNTRCLPPLPPDHPHKYHLPRPVILDTNLRFSVQSKLMVNYKAGSGRRPYVVSASPENGDAEEWNKRRDTLEAAGVRVIEVSREQGRVSISALLKALKDQGIRSLMVEGGASVIRSFLAESQSPSRVVDRVIVTVAPTFVGADGVGYNADISGTKTTKLVPIGTETFGPDAVLSIKFV